MTGKPTYEELEKRIQELEQVESKHTRSVETLRESEGMLRAISDTASDSIFCKDINRRYTFVNPSMLKLLAFTKTDLIGKTPEEVFDKEDAAIVNEVDDRTLNGENISEVRSININGEPYFFHTIQVPLLDSDGNITGIGGIVRDITESKQMEKALRESKMRMKAMSEASFEAIFISKKGICLEQNMAAKKMFGYTNAEILGRAGTEWIAPEDREQVMSNILSGNEKLYEVNALRKDGTIFPCEIQGKMIEYQGRSFRVTALQDITERKQAEETLRLMKYGVDHANDGIFWLNSKGHLIHVNNSACNTLGYSREELLSMHIAQVDTKISIENWPDRFAKLKHIKLDKFESQHLTKDGQLILIEVTSSYIEFEGEEGIFSFVRDITERKKAEEMLLLSKQKLKKNGKELKVANTLLNQEITERKQAEALLRKNEKQLKTLNKHLIYAEEKERSNISVNLHDTVVQTLGLSVSKIKTMEESDDVNNVAMLSDVQELIEQSLNEIRQLIYQLCPPVLKDFDIATAIGFLVEEINEKFHFDITFINNLEDSIDIDEPKKITLYRAANELILNIIKHSGVKEAKIEFSKNKSAVFLKVEDNGIGFDMAAINENHFNGFGLYGLSERCENMDGNVKIESILGKGTKTTICLPV